MNKVILLGEIKTHARVLAKRNGGCLLEMELETLEDDFHPSSGEPFIRSERHRLQLSGALAERYIGEYLMGKEVSVEGKLSYWKKNPFIRVTSLKPSETLNDSSMIPQLRGVPEGTFASPAFSSSVSRA